MHIARGRWSGSILTFALRSLELVPPEEMPPATKSRVVLDARLAGSNECLTGMPSATDGPTCHTWFTFVVPAGSFMVAKIVITPSDPYSAPRSETS